MNDGLMDGAEIADKMMEGIPKCLRVRMAMDTLASAITIEQRNEVESILSSYLEEAILVERDFDYESII